MQTYKFTDTTHAAPIAEIAISNDRMDFVSIFLAND